jgi:anaerobic selenocysteine-containing dehydrogenase
VAIRLSPGDVLLEIARGLQTPLDLAWETYEDMLRATYTALPGPDGNSDAWFDAEEKGGWWGDLPAALRRQSGASPQGTPVPFEAPRFDGDPSEFPMHFLPYASSAFLDGSLAHLPWLQEMPDPLTTAMWSSWIEINAATAGEMGVQTGDVVEVTSPAGSLRTAAVITPGIAPDVVAMPAGQGHRLFTRYASGRGENPVVVLAGLTEPHTGAPAWAATRVRVSRVSGPDGRLVLFAGGLREHAPEGR